MKGVTLSFVSEPRGDDYRQLLDTGLLWCDRGQLVVQSSIDLSRHGRKVLRSLGGHDTKTEERASWPGTILGGRTANVITFGLSAAKIAVLKESAQGLFDWIQPALPEDLALLCRDGTPWLTTIAHERDAFLTLRTADVGAVLQEPAGFIRLLREDLVPRPSRDDGT